MCWLIGRAVVICDCAIVPHSDARRDVFALIIRLAPQILPDGGDKRRRKGFPFRLQLKRCHFENEKMHFDMKRVGGVVNRAIYQQGRRKRQT